jgi:hypothetical protein
VSYIYQADVWCDACGRAICKRLKAAGKAPADPSNEWSYDSDDYPKRAGDDEESDTPEHCAAGEHCLNALTLPSGSKVGLLFGELTRDGVNYIRDALAEDEALSLPESSREVTALWRQHFRDKGYDL